MMNYRTLWPLLFLATATGCQDHMADQLLGRWIGQPDTSAKQAKRESLRYQDLTGPVQAKTHSVELQQPAASQHDLPPETSSQGAHSSIGATDWEQYDVQIFLEFARSQQVSMSLADGSEPRSGSWRVVRETPIGLVIEIEISQSEQPNNQEMPAQDDISTERRRFELQLSLDDRSDSGQSCVGFRLIELGADPRLGAIYFQREKEQ